MKLNKIVSSIAAVAMLSTSLVSVNAADAVEIVTDSTLGMDVKVVKTMPGEADLAARNPEVKIDVEFIPQADVATAVGNDIWAMQNRTNDVYKVTATFTNVGDLVTGYDTSYNNVTAGIYLAEAQINGIKGKLDIKAISFDGTQNGSSEELTMVHSTNDDYLLFRWKTLSSTSTYPEWLSTDTDAKHVEDPTFSFYGYIAVAAESQVEFTADDIYSQFLYKYGVDQIKNLNVKKPASVVFGEAEPTPPTPAEMEVTYDNDARFDLDVDDDQVVDGYAWEVVIENYDSTKTLSAKFTDENGNTRPGKEMTEISGFAETTSDISFVALLKLSQVRDVNFEIVVE